MPKTRKKEKIEELEKFLEELSSLLPITFKNYKKDFKIRAICERYFEKIIESIIDLSFLIIKEKNLKIPEEDKQAFDILEQGKLISKRLSEKLKEAKGMRNIISHEYGRIDDEIVFNAITEELEKDTKEFIKKIKNV